MSKVYSVLEICTLALTKIGQITEFDQGASKFQLDTAAKFLDLQVSHLSASVRNLWLVESTFILDLKAGETSFNLLDRMGTDAPVDGVIFPIRAFVREVVSNRDTPAQLLNRGEYDGIEKKGCTGVPCGFYIDRLATDNLVFPDKIPTADGLYQMGITIQRNPKDLTKTPLASKGLDLPVYWNKWAVTELARQLGDGPLVNRGDGELQRWQREIEALMMDLEGYANQEHADEPRRTAYNDF